MRGFNFYDLQEFISYLLFVSLQLLISINRKIYGFKLLAMLLHAAENLRDKREKRSNSRLDKSKVPDPSNPRS